MSQVPFCLLRVITSLLPLKATVAFEPDTTIFETVRLVQDEMVAHSCPMELVGLTPLQAPCIP